MKKERTKDRKKELWFWKSRFNVRSLQNIPNHIDHLNLRLGDISDQELLWICQRIHAINRLDLDDNPISDKGIQYLTHLVSIKELRLKGISELTDACICSLQKLPSLELLHLGGTSLSIEGIMQLKVLENLKTLLFSLDTQQATDKLESLASSLPNCSIVINGNPFHG